MKVKDLLDHRPKSVKYLHLVTGSFHMTVNEIKLNGSGYTTKITNMVIWKKKSHIVKYKIVLNIEFGIQYVGHIYMY